MKLTGACNSPEQQVGTCTDLLYSELHVYLPCKITVPMHELIGVRVLSAHPGFKYIGICKDIVNCVDYYVVTVPGDASDLVAQCMIEDPGIITRTIGL